MSPAVARIARAVIVALALTSTARGQDRGETTTPESAPLPANDRGKADGGDRVRWRSFELRGRFLLRGRQDTTGGDTTSALDVDNARLELRFRPSRSVRAVVEWDHAEGRHLKDAYVALRKGGFEVCGGQFKPPIAPIEDASRWDLPSADRGLLSEVLVSAFGIAGRRPGLRLSWNQKGDGLVATAGVFVASSVRGDRIGDEAFDNLAKGWTKLKTMARLSWRAKRFRAGVSFDGRPAQPLPGEKWEHLWTGSVDVEWSGRARRGPRLWAEAYVGSSWLDANPFDARHATFAAGRVLVGWRLLASKKRDVVIEPYAGASLLDPDTQVGEDLLSEVTGGVHLSAFGHLRLNLEAQGRDSSANAPLALGVYGFGSRPPRARTRLVVLIGAAF